MDDFEYLDPRDLNELVIQMKKTKKQKKDLTFFSDHAKILTENETKHNLSKEVR